MIFSHFSTFIFLKHKSIKTYDSWKMILGLGALPFTCTQRFVYLAYRRLADMSRYTLLVMVLTLFSKLWLEYTSIVSITVVDFTIWSDQTNHWIPSLIFVLILLFYNCPKCITLLERDNLNIGNIFSFLLFHALNSFQK